MSTSGNSELASGTDQYPTGEVEAECPRCGYRFGVGAALIDQGRKEWLHSHEDTIRDELRAQVELEAGDERRALEEDLAERREQLAVRDQENRDLHTKLDDMRKAEAKVRRRDRELADRERQMELRIERLHDAVRDEEQAKAKAQLADARAADQARVTHQVETAKAEIAREHEAEKNALKEQLNLARERAAALERGASTGARPTEVGFAMQDVIADEIRRLAPADYVTVTPRGRSGADVLDDVRTRLGRHVGTILIEVKMAQQYGGEWPAKLRDDVEKSHADLGIIAAREISDDARQKAEALGVWAYDFDTLMTALPWIRRVLVQRYQDALREAARDTQADRFYTYYTGQFVNRWGALGGTLQVLRAQVAAQKAATLRGFASVEKLLDRFETNYQAVPGDLDGLDLGIELPGTPLELPPVELGQEEEAGD